MFKINHKFVEKTTGKELDRTMVSALVKRVMIDGKMSRPEACNFVAGMFENTLGWQVYHMLDEWSEEEAEEMYGKSTKTIELANGKTIEVRDPNWSPLDHWKPSTERKISESRKRRFSLQEGDGTGKMNSAHKGAIPNASWYPSMDVYGHYRAMVMAASLPDEPKIPAYGPMADQCLFTGCRFLFARTFAG